jgi:hypothetical protein
MTKNSYTIIGSVAAKFHFPEYREPRDLDVLTEEPFNSSEYPDKRVETAWYGASSQWILDHTEGPYASPEVLYTIKAAQLKFNVFWEKTASDVIFFQRKNIPIIDELFVLCLADFKKLHGARWAKLKGKNSTTFFQDAVTRKYVHDSIHDAVAYYEEPLYQKILTGEGVQCSQDKFLSLDHEDQLKLAKEEIFVTALERFIIPADFAESRQRAYWMSLKKFVTTMSSGWMSRFLIDNFEKLAYNTDDYISKFKQNQNKLTLCH